MEDADDALPDAMPMPPQSFGMGDELPQRIEGCYRFLYYSVHMRDALEEKLTPREQATYDAALDCLKLYFLGETDHGSIPTKGQDKSDEPA